MVRMTIAATLVMLVCMAFHVPFAFQGAIYALMISRESSRATLQSAAALFLVTLVGAGYLLLSMSFVINSPPLHFLWVVGSFFFLFYAISTLTNYTASVALAIVLAVGIPLWDRHVSSETSVEDTLWLCWSVVIGVAITTGVELMFTRLRGRDEIVLLIAERLAAVQDLCTCYAEGRSVEPGVGKTLIRLGTLGTSLLRRTLRRSGYSPQYSADMGSVAVFVGRLVDLATTVSQLSPELSVSDRRRFRNLGSTVAIIRDDLMNGRTPHPVQLENDRESASLVPLLGEMEHTVTLISQPFADSQSVEAYLPSTDDAQGGLLVPDAFVNPEHLQFALKGCLASTSCYVIYNAIAWPGISTAVTTCLLTALSTIGSSRQKQVLRITGAIVGGFLIGTGSQMFVLPYVDSIAGFTVLFVAVTVFSSWFMTSSPRLSYFGIQVALAFYLINLSEFKMQTSLSVARDRVVGILLGLFLMWLVFDQLWGAPAAIQMRKTFISNLRLVAEFAREPVSKDLKTAIARSFALRETISTNLDKVRSIADAVLFEFGPSREQDLALRDRIRNRQPSVRMLFILQNAAWKYRARLSGFELPETIATEQREFDNEVARVLSSIADRMEGRLPTEEPSLDNRFVRLERSIERYSAASPQDGFDGRLPAFLALYRRIASVGTSLQQEMQSAPAG